MAQYLLNGTVIAIGLLLLTLAWVLFRRPTSDPWLVRFGAFLGFPLLFQVGYALVLMGFGLDRWDDASAWYWDTWLGFGAAALLAMLFAVTRFRGAARVVLTLLAAGWFAYPFWFYWTAQP